MKRNLVEIGRISGPKGLRGKMWVTPYGDSPERFSSYTHLIVEGQGISRKVLSSSLHRGRYVLELEGIGGIDEVESLKGRPLFITEDQLEPLGEDEYYWKDLMGLTVVGEDGRELGKIVRIFSTGSNDVLVVDPVKEHYIPVTKDVVKSISPEKGLVLIDTSLLDDLLG